MWSDDPLHDYREHEPWHIYTKEQINAMVDDAKRRLDEQITYGWWRTREEQERLFRERAEARERSAHKRCMGCFNRTEYCTCGRAQHATRCLFCSNLYAQCTCVQRLNYPNAITTTCTEEKPSTDIVRFVEETVGQPLADWQRRHLTQLWAEAQIHAQFNKPTDFTRINTV